MPDTCMKIFNDRMFDIMNIVHRERQICYFLGDLNVDLLKHESHQSTAAFLDSFYPYNVFLLITKPRGVTRESATLIDHVLINNFDNNIQNMYTEFYVQAYLTIILLFIYNLISQFYFVISDKAFCIKEHVIGKTMVYNEHH